MFSVHASTIVGFKSRSLRGILAGQRQAFITHGLVQNLAPQTRMPGRSEPHNNAMEVVSLVNYSFFLGRDLTKLPHPLVQKLRPNDEHQKLIASVLGFVVCSADFAELI